jgi:hypothetical protein
MQISETRCKMKRKFVGLSMAGALLVGSNLVAASDYMAGPLADDQYANLVKIKNQGVQGNSFSDMYSFTVAPSATFVSENLINNVAGKGWDISGLSMRIFDSADIDLTGATTSFKGMLSPGSYYAKVTGTAAGRAGGSYTFFASAVPEASTWEMIVVGIGIVALRLSRRNGAQPSAIATKDWL